MNGSRSETISKIANIIKDYSNLPATVSFNPMVGVNNHVERWVYQFEEDDIDFILDHTHKVLSKNYYSEDRYDELLKGMARNKGNEKHFNNDCFVNVQSHGGSQRDILNKLNEFINDELGFSVPVFYIGGDRYKILDFKYITYIDDFSFSGKLIGDDIEKIIVEMGLDNVNIRIVAFLVHTQGFYSLKKRLENFVKDANLNIGFYFNKRHWGDVENSISSYYSWKSSIYFPDKDTCDQVLMDKGLSDVELYQPGCFRLDSSSDCILGDIADRVRIERIFSSVGFDIIGQSVSPKKSMKPLGFSTYRGFGFGGNIFSYRNCPNNTPLVFWWGSYEKTGNAAIDCWYPLMKRRGYHV